ncbi:MAG: N-alpha-acetyl diaminobutyric acid deacetylase DoeB [Gammaproteobacteria bacterium]
MTRKTKIGADVDFERDGRQVSFLRVPHSTNESGWGTLLMPIVVIKNGQGPTMLFTGGNHGDEYEGPLTLLKLSRQLAPESVNGRVIVLPGLNYPALKAGTRLSPVDGKNMNRVFPGEHDGTVTAMIAHYVATELLPMCDVVVDLHSGGSSMIFEPSVVIHHLTDAGLMQKTLAAARDFGAPVTLVLIELDPGGMLDTAAEETGKIFISAELGGGAFVTPRSLEVAETGVDNLLRHFGLVEGEIVKPEHKGRAPTRIMETPANGAYLMSMADGLYEALVEVGEEAEVGAALGRIHFPDSPDHEPVTVNAEISGVLITRAGRGWVKRGDTIAVVATDVKNPSPHFSPR